MHYQKPSVFLHSPFLS